MNLDDKQQLAILDPDQMLKKIQHFPDDLAAAWELGQTLPLPTQAIDQVFFCGMGHSANAGDLLKGLLQPSSPLIFRVYRGYELPKWAQTPRTLVILSSFSGETEEIFSLHHQAIALGLPCLLITTGGTLAQQNKSALLWQYQAVNDSRTALGWQLGFLLALAYRMGWLTELDQQIPAALENLYHHRELYGIDTQASTNPAKRKGGQLIERLPIIYGAGIFEAVAYRWKTMLNATAKLMAMFEAIPEANHHSIVGMEFPVFLMPHVIPIMIRSAAYDYPRVALRYDLMTRLFLENGISPNQFLAVGASPLAQMLHTLQYTDYASFYAALGSNVNPASVDLIRQIKADLSELN